MPLKHVRKSMHGAKYHILPHPVHKKRATLLQSSTVFIYSVAMILLMVSFRGLPRLSPGILSYASNIKVEDLLKYTNDRRDAAGVNKLTINPKLSAAAHKKAEHMFRNNYWAHVAPDGTDPWAFIVAEDYDYIYAGENLAKNFNSSKDVVDAWYKSQSHKENLMSEKYDEVGFAAVDGVLDGYETTLVVQMFGKLRAGPAQVAVKGNDSNTSVRTEPVPVTASVPAPAPQTAQPIVVQEPLPVPAGYRPAVKINVYSTTRMVTVVMAAFMFALFVIDLWYSKRHGILKCTGHSFAHMAFLIFAISVIYFTLQPGRLI